MKIFRSHISKLAISSLTLALTLNSCKDDYLEKLPLGNVSPETVFATTGNAYAAINGMHRHLYSQWYSRQSDGGQGTNMIYMDVLGEDYVMTGAANGWFNNAYKWLDHRDENADILRFHYGFYYALIGNANQIIFNIDEADGPEEDKNFIKAQAYTYRAWSYFQMIQLFSERYEKRGDNS